jgi:hypothetical protein
MKPLTFLAVGRTGSSRMTGGAILCVLLSVAGGKCLAAGYRFTAPEVLNLSSSDAPRNHPPGREVARQALDPKAAEAISKRAVYEADSPFQLPLLGVEGKQARSRERMLIAPQGAAVQRSGRRLTITPVSGRPVAFEDWAAPPKPRVEGDGEKFLYAGRMSGSGYYRVEVQYEHDSPGSFLVNPVSGRMAHAHNGSDVVVLSPSGGKILVFDTLNPPFALAVASLGRTGPTLELLCRFGLETDRVRGHAGFVGWRDDNAFELLFALEATPGIAPAVIPARLEMTGDDWKIFTPENRLQAALPRLTCQQFGTK